MGEPRKDGQPIVATTTAPHTQSLELARHPILSRLPTLRPDQLEIATHPARVKVVCMGRRYGKSTLGQVLCIWYALGGGSVAWVVPTYKNARPLWRMLEQAVARVPRNLYRMHRQDHILEFPETGGWIGVYSADNDVGLRGEAFDLAVLDEAAMMPESTFTDVIMPTLADRAGTCVIITTPKGRNWVWVEWTKAKLDGVYARAWTAPTSANPMPTIQHAFREARERLPERTFRQEWLAEFLEDGAGVFRHVSECIYDDPYPISPEKYREKHKNAVFVGGLDWGRVEDSTVLVVMDARRRRVVDVLVTNKIEYQEQFPKIAEKCRKWGVRVVKAEGNAVGHSNIVELRRKFALQVSEFKTGNKTKDDVIQKLVVDIEQERISYPDIPELEQLRAYQLEILPNSGLTRYSAPEGVHDDFVIALALANKACSAVPADFGNKRFY